jgi:hypothetical protein
MEKRKFIQYGTFSIVLLILLLVISTLIIILSGEGSNFEISLLFFLILTFLICLSIFYKITITVDDTHLSFSMGIGFIHKKYLLSDIESCKPVKNPIWYGIGIRITPTGWLYNVSGRYAIEINFKTKKSNIRIGTNMPELVSKLVNEHLEQINSKSNFEGPRHNNYTLIWSFLILIFTIPLIMILFGSRDNRVEFSNTSFEIKGQYGLTVYYTKIIQVDTINSLPGIGRRTNGFAFGKTLKGNFKLYDQRRVKLFIKRGTSPYIFIKTNENQIYLNFNNPNKTLTTYNKILSNLTIKN